MSSGSKTIPSPSEWLAILGGTGAAVLVKGLSGAQGRLLVRDRDTVGSLGDDTLDREAIARARARLRARFPASGSEEIGGAEVFFDVTLPPPELVIFGAGPDAEPLARLGWELGFTVTVVDARAAFLTPERFPHAVLISAHFSRFHEALALHRRSYAVIMNHHLERDRESLRFALESGAAYIGALGPRSRFQKLLGGLHEQGVVLDPAQVARVHSPVGLALGAESPEEIAVSIMGEILAIQRGFDGWISRRPRRQPSPLFRQQCFRAFVVFGRVDVEQQFRGEVEDRAGRPGGAAAPAGRRAPGARVPGRYRRSKRCGGAVTSP